MVANKHTAFTLAAPKATRDARRYKRKLQRAVGRAKIRNLQGEELRMFVLKELNS